MANSQVDIYGRPLPIPAWVDKPTECGYYFYSASKKDWDLARPVAVTSSEFYLDGKWVKKFYAYIKNVDIDVDSILPGACWFGPFRIAKPDWD